jgi:hypothetical protein
MLTKPGASILLAASVYIGLLCVPAIAFEAQCTLPFEKIKKENPAVADCPLHGSAIDEAQQAQNRAKNNLCATGNPVNLTFRHFTRLQRAAEDKEIPFGSHNKVPDDRSALNNLIGSCRGVGWN